MKETILNLLIPRTYAETGSGTTSFGTYEIFTKEELIEFYSMELTIIFILFFIGFFLLILKKYANY